VDRFGTGTISAGYQCPGCGVWVNAATPHVCSAFMAHIRNVPPVAVLGPHDGFVAIRGDVYDVRCSRCRTLLSAVQTKDGLEVEPHTCREE
jgi:hypothetical protein